MRDTAGTATTTARQPRLLPDMVSYDTSISQTPTGGPDLYAHSRNTFDGEATWMGLMPVALSVGYTNNHNGYDSRTFQSTNENALHLKADTAGFGGVTFRAHYELSSRSGSGLDEASLVAVGEQPGMRHYDVADRSRNRFTGQVELAPSEALMLSVSASVGSDDFDESYFGLQESSFRTFTASADYMLAGGIWRRRQLQLRALRGPPAVPVGQLDPAEMNDPNRDWTADSKERVHYFSLFVQSPQIKGRTEARVSYDFSDARGNYLYAVGPALPAPNQLPETYNKLQDLRLDVRHKVTGRVAATLSYTYQPYRIYDFAFDPSVIDSIVQPSTLVLGYTYRPYTAHTAVFGILYFW